jgi:hypothetical protein
MIEKNADRNATGTKDRKAVLRDRLAIAAAVAALLVVGFMSLDMAVINFECSFADFVTFECNRWGQLWEASRRE